MPRVVATSIGRDGVHLADLTGAPEELWVQVAPTLNGKGRADLDLILSDHRAARAQARLTPTASQDNGSVRTLLKALDRLAADDRSGRALIDAMIRDLGGEAGFKVHLALVRIAPRQQGREATHLEEFDEAELREALAPGFSVANGPRKDLELRRTVSRLVHLYEACSGRRATHSNRKNALYEQAPQSPAGRLVTACIRAVDAETADSAISAALAECLRARKKPPVQTL